MDFYESLYDEFKIEFEDWLESYPDLAMKLYMGKKFQQLPEFKAAEYKVKRSSYLLLAVSLVFFPLFAVLLYRMFQRSIKLNSKLSKIHTVTNSIKRAHHRPFWVKQVSKPENFN